ncbi:MAG TPA: phosphoribosylaminoimidazolesuccinocarboxamide synthase [Acidimicrobiales bacterium]|nr:phosphoribosylaminoimidazolesuccinocarboxamide synthase [Acidimicrobiales bacterium]
MTFTKVYSGKVRDLYETADGFLVLVASDRMSAFDVVMREPVPDKGRVLTAMSAFWFEHLRSIAPNHLLALSWDGAPSEWEGRMMVVRRAEMLPIECIVRGYVAGSAWKDYQASQAINGIRMPAGMLESDRLDRPIFTPSTKAPSGTHDENISFDDAVSLVGGEIAERARALSLAVYQAGAARAEERGIIVADTKLELGFVDGELVIADEVLTPDSSRFWPADEWKPGITPPAFDKQPLRDWLEAQGWDKQPPPPPLPREVVEASRSRYVEAYERITGLDFADWPGRPAAL